MDRRMALLGAGGVTVAVLAGAQAAYAGHTHAIQTAPSPSTGQPIAGGGSWIVNKPSGYYIGRAMPADTFDNEVTTTGNWHYGRAVTGVNMCGWVLPGSLGADRGDVADSCSAATREALSHRRTVGRDYNAAAHEATDGSAAPAVSGCTLYYNYFHGSDFAANGGHWANPAAGGIGATVRYRFTTNDGAAAIVRDDVQGWGFVPIGCVTRPARLFNDND
ncbi:hypothetical protein [Dactylosporangium matsuzakiense]|nr:hypothetical protein [Dactylosporangium matsuzakiense]UWZ41407.1 hypothetical protein Dmats_27480 [Dactylosporangium matsuzakiense]